jgi:uncharacterized membrane protein
VAVTDADRPGDVGHRGTDDPGDGSPPDEDGERSRKTARADGSPPDEGGGRRRDGRADPDADPPRAPDIADAMDELVELEELVDSPAEREQVREAMRTLGRARRRPALFGRLRGGFDLRDAGEALVGSFVFGIPMVVEGGTLEVGTHIADRPVLIGLTALLGVGLVLGILRAVGFAAIEDDLLLGVVPRRLIGILVIAGGTALVLMTVWGRVDWAEPRVAASQTLVTAVVMAVGASLGDLLPES